MFPRLLPFAKLLNQPGKGPASGEMNHVDHYDCKQAAYDLRFCRSGEMQIKHSCGKSDNPQPPNNCQAHYSDGCYKQCRYMWCIQLAIAAINLVEKPPVGFGDLAEECLHSHGTFSQCSGFFSPKVNISKSLHLGIVQLDLTMSVRVGITVMYNNWSYHNIIDL